MARPRRALALAATTVAALTLAGVAHGQTYQLVSSDVQATVRPNGSVAVDEAITVAFSGSFTYGFREIPLRSGERLDEIGVSENGRPFRPGASTELEPGGPPGTFGVRELDGRVRIVWRFQSDGAQQRTFVVHYRLSGLAVGYDDVVDVNLKVWGDEWERRRIRNRLHLTMSGCLGPCAAGNNALLLIHGRAIWLNDLNNPSLVPAVFDYAEAMLAAGRVLPPPPVLSPEGLDRLTVSLSAARLLGPAGDEGGPTERTFGRFLLREVLGRGKFGVVFLADDPQSGRATRVGRQRHEDGTSTRIAKKSGAALG